MNEKSPDVRDQRRPLDFGASSQLATWWTQGRSRPSWPHRRSAEPLSPSRGPQRQRPPQWPGWRTLSRRSQSPAWMLVDLSL